jgi:hypothetical protein
MRSSYSESDLMLCGRDMYMAQHSPDEIEFGHVCETPKDWEQRFEKINFRENTHQGKVLRIFFLSLLLVCSVRRGVVGFMCARSISMCVYCCPSKTLRNFTIPISLFVNNFFLQLPDDFTSFGPPKLLHPKTAKTP